MSPRAAIARGAAGRAAHLLRAEKRAPRLHRIAWRRIIAIAVEIVNAEQRGRGRLP